MKYRLYGYLHRLAKRVLRRNVGVIKEYEFVDFPETFFEEENSCEIKKEMVYPVENLMPVKGKKKYPKSFVRKREKWEYAKDQEEAYKSWEIFVANSVIPKGYKNDGCHYAGYIKEYGQWCLPSWIWTNAAIVRFYCNNGELQKARILGERLIDLQQECGGWIVRDDYSSTGTVPQLAPNDSCYMALNCCLELYEAIKEQKYLESAEETAAWVMETARPDGLIYLGYDVKQQKWEKEKNIVDIGFAGGLFARLYEITGKEAYKQFLKRFINSYIKCFYLEDEKCFATAIGKGDKPLGGTFARGQGWALEGLIPAYRVLGDKHIKKVIDNTVETLLDRQYSDGSWAYNLSRPMMGVDCKGVSVIAKCLLDWYFIKKKDTRLANAATRALQWCVSHTVVKGTATGGIFSYTTEGAVVHHLYTSTAFVYASAYAEEVRLLLKDLKYQRSK